MNTVRRSRFVQKRRARPPRHRGHVPWRCKKPPTSTSASTTTAPPAQAPQGAGISSSRCSTRAGLSENRGAVLRRRSQAIPRRPVRQGTPFVVTTAPIVTNVKSAGRPEPHRARSPALHPQRLYAGAQAHDALVPPDGTARGQLRNTSSTARSTANHLTPRNGRPTCWDMPLVD